MRKRKSFFKRVIPECFYRGSKSWIPACAGMTLFIGVLLCCASLGHAQEGKVFLASGKPAGKMFIGEKITFVISYLGIPVGEAESVVKEIVKVNGRDTYHIEMNVRSRSILDWIYKVRDTHHSYIDVEKLYSLRYEKKIHEGRYWTDEVVDYDQDAHIGYFYSRKDNSRKEMLIPKNVQDQISCGYYYRTLNVKPNTKATIPVNADEKNWDVEILAHGIKKMKVDDVGTFQAIEIEPIILFEGFFVRRGKVRGWMSMDERRIPLLLKVKIPVLGNIKAKLVKYEPGQEVLSD